jgi:hypothetical protein
VQIDLEAISDGVIIDAGGEAAGAHQGIAVETGAIGHRAEFVGSAARMPAPPTANIKAQFAGPRIQAAFERSHDRGCDPRGMPVHPHHGAERLKPERVAQPREQFAGSVMIEDAFGDRCAEFGHALGQPCRHTPAVQR